MPAETGQMALNIAVETKPYIDGLQCAMDGLERLHGHPRFKLGTQLSRVHSAMMGGEWASLAEIALKAGVPETTVGSRIRDLRKLYGHEHTIHVREVTSTGHLHVYRMEEKNV